jgi:hypothetical protein
MEKKNRILTTIICRGHLMSHKTSVSRAPHASLSKRRALFLLSLASSFLLPSLSLSADWVVEPQGKLSSIQSAVEKAGPGDRILIRKGVYKEVVRISSKKDLQLIADEGAELQLAEPVTNPVVLLVENSQDVRIVGLRINGMSNGVGDKFYGIAYAGSTGLIKDVTVTGVKILQGDRTKAIGIVIDGSVGASTVTVAQTRVQEFGKAGIAVHGAGARVIIRDCVITGMGRTSEVPQNGIQLTEQASGSLIRNAIEGCWFTGEKWAATGILLTTVSEVLLQENVIRGCLVGIGYEHGDNKKLVNNTFTECKFNVVDWGAEDRL